MHDGTRVRTSKHKHAGEVRIWEVHHFHHFKPGSRIMCFHHFKPNFKVDFHQFKPSKTQSLSPS